MGILIRVKEIHLAKLAVSQYVSFMDGVQKLVNAAGSTALGIDAKIFELFKENLARLKSIVEQEKTDVDAGKLAVLDQERDGLLVHLVTSVRNACSLPIDEVKKAALNLYKITENYMGVENFPNDKETKCIDELTAKLQSSDRTADLIKLGLLSVAEVLRMKNNEFAQQSHTSAAAVVAEAKVLRVGMNAQFRDLAEMANAANISTPSAATTKFVNQLNDLIDKAKTAAKPAVN